ncbi:hypothetical protein GE061_002574 [Apolygus lucorum]|uniref:Uncharacterized protein n=1 Tax=Apolygus lucorum TaxID=248454 RepID=A0A8S9X6W0_APOLU|nr:hypothetical protein GE061_002574 [Apolygus lucorum]
MLQLPIMAKLILSCLLVALWLNGALAEDKWVWGGSGRSAKLSRDPVKGRYGVIEEPDLPYEPYSPVVRPPPSNLPPLVRPTPSDRPYDGRFDTRPNNSPRPGLGAYYSRPGVVGGDRLPGGYDRPGGFDRPYDRHPNEAGRYPGPTPPFVRPPPPINPTKPAIIGSHEDNDPTKFDKCKCTHSFNCKSPGISFGSCDAGKKYCCEKRIHHSNGIPSDDGSIPEVLAGPGGPVDHLRPQGHYNDRDLYGRLEPRRP